MSPSDAIDENGTLIGEILSHLKNLGDLPDQWNQWLMASLSPARCTMASSTGLWDKVERNVRNLVPEGVAIHLDYGSWLLHMVICI